MSKEKTRRVYTTGDRIGAVVVLSHEKTVKAGFGKKKVLVTGLLLEDERTGGLTFSRRRRGTIFDTSEIAENAARRYRRLHPDAAYQVMTVGRREVDRVKA